jgi:hypothetical protein
LCHAHFSGTLLHFSVYVETRTNKNQYQREVIGLRWNWYNYFYTMATYVTSYVHW